MDRRNLAWIALVTVAGVLATLFLSPLLLEFIRRTYSFLNWQELSNVGQSYTGFATILSVLAFSGVVYSVFVQTRQNAAQQQHAARTFQFDLLTMAIERRDLAGIWADGGSMSIERHAKFARNGYMNLWFRYLQYAFIVGNLTDEALLSIVATDMFSNSIFRDWWTGASHVWRAEATSTAERHFIGLIDGAAAEAEGRVSSPDA